MVSKTKNEESEEILEKDFKSKYEYFQELVEKGELDRAQQEFIDMLLSGEKYTDKKLARLWDKPQYKIRQLRLKKLGIEKTTGGDIKEAKPISQLKKEKSKNSNKNKEVKREVGLNMSGRFKAEEINNWLSNLVRMLESSPDDEFDIILDIEKRAS